LFLICSYFTLSRFIRGKHHEAKLGTIGADKILDRHACFDRHFGTGSRGGIKERKYDCTGQARQIGSAYGRNRQELVGIAGGNPDGIFLYVEIGKKWISSHLYKREGKLVRELDIPDTYLAKLIRKAWRLEPNKPNMRWSVMNYGIKKVSSTSCSNILKRWM